MGKTCYVVTVGKIRILVCAESLKEAIKIAEECCLNLNLNNLSDNEKDNTTVIDINNQPYRSGSNVWIMHENFDYCFKTKISEKKEYFVTAYPFLIKRVEATNAEEAIYLTKAHAVRDLTYSSEQLDCMEFVTMTLDEYLNDPCTVKHESHVIGFEYKPGCEDYLASARKKYSKFIDALG